VNMTGNTCMGQYCYEHKQSDTTHANNPPADQTVSKVVRGCATTSHELEKLEVGGSHTTFHGGQANGESISNTKLCNQPLCN